MTAEAKSQAVTNARKRSVEKATGGGVNAGRRTRAIAYMDDVGEGREPGAEALHAKRALQLNTSRTAETLLHCSELPLVADVCAQCG